MTFSFDQQVTRLEDLCKTVRYYILRSTTQAGSGHPSSSLSAVELMTTLLAGGFFHYNIDKPGDKGNDRMIFSKGHASPLLYTLWRLTGVLKDEDLDTLRQFGSVLEGHPTPRFPYVDVATGSLGQGLSIGVGMALDALHLHTSPRKTFVLLGDSELAEGQNWEAIRSASYYKLNNLVALVDINKYGQRGETMDGYDIASYEKRFRAFGWDVVTVDGHSCRALIEMYSTQLKDQQKPLVILAQTVKGKGVSIMEGKEGWHSKVLTEAQFETALKELGPIRRHNPLSLPRPTGTVTTQKQELRSIVTPDFSKALATKKVYGYALAKSFEKHPSIVALDGEVSNSTCAIDFATLYPERYFEMFIAEQHMVSVAVGLANRGNIPFVSTFAAFLTRSFDQIRMAQYSQANIKLIGSYAGVSIGKDGPSQMGLEDIAMMRSIQNSVVLYPSDAISMVRLVECAASHKGMVYIRATREAVPSLYAEGEQFQIGGSHVLRQTLHDHMTIVAAGITVFEALKAGEELQKIGILVRVIDLYSIKPLDIKTLTAAAQQTEGLLVVEDHVPEGGIGEAVRSALTHLRTPVYSLAVTKRPMSGSSAELLEYEEIDATAIQRKVLAILR